MNKYFKQPSYFSSFSCMGGKCPVNCCYGWIILWKQEEMDKVLNGGCSKELADKMKNCFEPIHIYGADQFSVKLRDDRGCPMLTEDHMCSIQRELGEDFLGKTCTQYPRKHLLIGDTVHRVCSASCYVVMDKLCNFEKASDLINTSVSAENTHAKKDSQKSIQERPEKKFRREIFDFFYESLESNKRPFEVSVVLGALAAKNLTKLIERGEIGRIPEAIKIFRAQFNNPDEIEKLQHVKPNYNVKFGLVSEIMEHLSKNNFLDPLRDSQGVFNIDKYNLGLARFNQVFADRQFYLKNIALNNMLDLAFPFSHDFEGSIFENYLYWVASVATIKLLSCAAGLQKNEQKIEEVFKITSAYFIRSFCHSPTNIPKVLDLLKEYNITSPAYTMLLLK